MCKLIELEKELKAVRIKKIEMINDQNYIEAAILRDIERKLLKDIEEYYKTEEVERKANELEKKLKKDIDREY